MPLNGSEAPTASEELKELGKEVQNALTALREATETKNKDTMERVQKFFDKYEDANSKFARQVADYEKQTGEMKSAIAAAEQKVAEAQKGTKEYEERVKHLELLHTTMQAGINKKAVIADPRVAFESERADNAEYKAFMHWFSKDGMCRQFKSHSDIASGVMHPAEWALANLDLKTLRTDSESAGGYLIPQVMDNQIRKNIIELSPVRSHARVRTSPGKTMDIPRRLSVPLAQFEGEAETAPTDQSIYGSEQITCYRQTVTIPATLDMMVSSAFDLEKEIASDVGESFAAGEGTNFVKGNGRKGPQGFMVDTRTVGFTTAGSATFDFVDLTKMAGGLKRGQNPWWYFNRRTLAFIQSLKSTIGVPVWQPVAGNTPATIWGWPYDSNMIDMDDVTTGSGAKPVAFADLTRGYEIYDMIGMNVVRDDLTRKKEAITEWTFRRYLTGRVILPEAISVMTLL